MTRRTTTASKGSIGRRICDFFCPSLSLWPFRFGTKRHFVPASEPIISQLIGRGRRWTRKRRTSSSSMDGAKRESEVRHKSQPAFFDERGILSPSTKKWVRFSINQAPTQRLMRRRSLLARARCSQNSCLNFYFRVASVLPGWRFYRQNLLILANWSSIWL